ncbi:hypothetical protein Tco_1565596, partial [Tanacetum coccineum]
DGEASRDKKGLMELRRVWVLATTTQQMVIKQTATGKEISNPLIADSLLKTVRLSLHLVIAMKHWLVHKQTAHGKDMSNPFMAGSLPKTTKPT